MNALAFAAAREAFERQILAADDCACDGRSARLATCDAEFLGSEAYLRAIADSVGDRCALGPELARSRAAFVAIVSQLSPSDAATAVPARIADGPRVLVDGPGAVRGTPANARPRAHSRPWR